FFFDYLHKLAENVFVSVGTGMLEQEFLLLVWKGVIATALLIVPTVLMGGTLPLVAAWLQRNQPDASRASARFYAINSLGAVTGSFVAGFIMVQALGMVATLQTTALVNLFVGGAAIVIARRNGKLWEGALVSDTEKSKEKLVVTETETQETKRLFKLAVALVALTGGVSMGLEVLAARSLVLLFGASLQSFALVLVAFILGIGFGAGLISSPKYQWARRELATVVLLVAAAFWIGFFIWSAEGWVNIYRELRTAVARTATGYQLQLVLNVLIAIIVLGIPAALLGAVLPLWIRAGKDGKGGLAEHVGRLLTWNTIGAVVGVLLTGFFLMPVFGVRAAFGILALALCAGGIALASKNRLQSAFMGSCLVGGFVLFTMATGGDTWQHVMSSGVFRLRETVVNYSFLPRRAKEVKIIYYKDAPDATVSVESVTHEGEQQISLRINGKTDASSHGDLSTQLLLGHLGLLARPDAENMFILGLGSGITASAALTHPNVKEIVVAENCKPVVESAALFGKWNREVLKDPKVKVVFEDARTVLKLGKKNYDVIVCEPSNPWLAGVGSVFSQEFYELAASHLKEDGVVVQWFHVYEMHDGVVDLVTKTFSTVFPYMEIWDPGTGDFIMVGSTKPWAMSLDGVRKAMERPLVREDFEKIGLTKPEHVFLRQMASARTAFAIPDGMAVQSDAFPVLEYEAPRAFFLGQRAEDFLRFDERTWQSSLASAEKQKILRSLTTTELMGIFKDYKSVNPILTSYLKQRFTAGTNETMVPVFADNNPTPFIFQTYEGYKNLPNLPPEVTAEHKAVLTAEAQIYTVPAKWREGVEVIEKTINDLGSKTTREGLKWKPDHFLCLAVRTALANGDFGLAERLLKLEQYVEETREMRYLKRIVAAAAPVKTAANTPLPLVVPPTGK
ncbi:MAG: spermine/spermidine synthase family protein, partial [Verrucomicrobia bacterium]|nr:spermine/spermidine synthase family protein [Verrucomicrobiota bacterium]